METLPRIRNYRINYPSDVVFCLTRSLLISNLVLNESKMNFQALPSQRFLRIRVFPTDPWLLQGEPLEGLVEFNVDDFVDDAVGSEVGWMI